MDLGQPASYLTLTPGVPVYSSDGKKLGVVEHVLADPDKDIFDGIVFDASPLPGGHRFVDAPDVDEIYERGVVLKLDAAAAAERLHRPEANPGTLSPSPDDLVESELQHKLRRAWNLISGNY
jgi:sporulation protein YlmC with PRC-barrel domain